MVFLLPLNGAHAATATVSLSTITSGVETAATSGTVGSSLTITGNGFASGKPIAITTTIGTTVTSWFTSTSQNTCSGAFTGNIGGIGTANSLYTGSGSTACLTTTAGGAFKTTVTVPSIPGGAQTIVVTDGSNSVSTAFTITPAVSLTVTTGNSNFGFPEQGVPGSITVTGFGAVETVTEASTAFTSTGLTCTTTTAGTCTIAGPFTVADTTGGSKSITATGGTTSLTASTTFTINPWAAFYNSQNSQTVFSFLGTAPTSLVIEAHGLPSGTIAANSITIGGVAASNAAITVGTTGAIYDIVVAPSANVPFGQANVVIGGTTFSYAAGNIAASKVTPGTSVTTGSAAPWGGVLISSILGHAAVGTGVVTSDATSYKPGSVTAASSTSPAPQQNAIAFFGYGFVNTGASIAAPTGASFTTLTPTADANGAIFAVASLGETPWSTVSAPSTAATYTPAITQNGGPANILGPSFTITPWIDTSFGAIGATTVNYQTATESFKAHGFGATDALTAKIGGITQITGGTCSVTSGACTTGTGQVPDLSAGAQTVTITGSISGQTATATGAVTYVPYANFANTSPASTALSIVQGPSGSTTILRTSTGSTGFGVHGLSASSAYSIVWNGMGSTQVLGTFTSTATGGIPVPGVQITLPADVAGVHVVDIQATSSLGTSALFGQTLQDLSLTDTADTAGLGATYTSNYGDLLFNLGTSLIAAPTVANVGQSVSISGNGLTDSTQYDLGVSIAGIGTGTIPTTCSLTTATNPALPPTVIVGTFTSTSTGAVPTGTSLALTDMPTVAGHEQGTLYCAYAQTGASFGTTIAVGTAQFLLAASGTLNMTGAAIGHSIIITAHALAANTGYNVIFAPYTNPGTSTITGTVVGAVLANQNGAGFATFSIPSNVQTASGSQPVVNGQSYTVELQASGSTTVALASPPSVTVGSSSVSGCNTTSCMSVNGTPSMTTQGAYQGISSVFTNNSNAPITGFVYAVVHNALGQTVDISTATISAPAGGSITAFNVLFGLPPATYTVSIFVVSSSGTAISTSTPVTVTIA